MTKDERLLIAIDAELKDRLQAAASFEGVSMSEMIRRLIKSIPVIGYIKDGNVIPTEHDLELLKEGRRENAIREEG